MSTELCFSVVASRGRLVGATASPGHSLEIAIVEEDARYVVIVFRKVLLVGIVACGSVIVRLLTKLIPIVVKSSVTGSGLCGPFVR